MREFSITILNMLIFAIAGNVDAQFLHNEEHQKQMAMTSLSSMPLTFIENRGQWHEDVLFKAEVNGSIFFFCANEVVCLLTRNTDESIGQNNECRYKALNLRGTEIPPQFKKDILVIKMQFVNANPDPGAFGVNRLLFKCNYFYGNDPSQWRTDIPGFSSILYKDIYPGIDLKYYGDGKGLKYDITVNPGADLSRIKIRYEGVDELTIDHDGCLQAETRFGPIHENTPFIYQEKGGERSEITGRHVIFEPNVFGFVLDNKYNRSLPLVIDPVLVYCTYIGGERNDEAYDIAIDNKGNAYVTGMVRSYEFPTVNPFDDSLGQNSDAFVTKISPAGDQFIYSTYIGSADPYHGGDFGDAIEVDESGCVYITGYAGGADFPIANAFDSTFNGRADAFLLKLAPTGNSIVFSTFLGGSHIDVGYGLAIDYTNNIFLTGRTRSTDFPTVNAYDASQNDTSSGWGDGFIAKFFESGDSLIYSTFLGGSTSDIGLEIACDLYGCAYVGGWTESEDFPKVNSFDSTHAGESDAFIAKLSVAGNDLIYSTLLGTSERDVIIDIEVDALGNAYVCGYTEQSDFPTVNAYDNSYNGDTDVFVTKINPDGNNLIYSTYLGGSSQEKAFGLELDSTYSAYVTGYTCSDSFPLVNPYDDHLDPSDVFITRFSPEGNSLLFSTFVGGSSSEEAEGIAVSEDGDIYVAGYTYSYDFATPFAFDTSLGWPNDGFAFRLSMMETTIPEPLPIRKAMAGNYPNPFNSTTIIRYDLLEPSFVTVNIYDLLGRKVETLFNGQQVPGAHSITWHAGRFSSGIYFYRIRADGFSETKKMLLIK
ncbi:MAG: SBBP repeat-containing protein [Candidatus Zixiibacteriota bacterium]|nr:MAG: SBBP repeat-containing protein [candidate division Zixibacteria bacterium]